MNMNQNINGTKPNRNNKPASYREDSEDGRPFDANDFQTDDRYHEQPVSYEPTKHVNPTKTTYYPPPPDDDHGPGRFNKPTNGYHHPTSHQSQNQPPTSQYHQPEYRREASKPSLVNRGIQYEEPYHQHSNARPQPTQHQEQQQNSTQNYPTYNTVPFEKEDAPSNNNNNSNWPPVNSSTLDNRTHERPNYQPPPPTHNVHERNLPSYNKPSHSSSNHHNNEYNTVPTQQPQQSQYQAARARSPVENNENHGRFDPQVILENQRKKQGNYANPNYVNSIRDPVHQPKPLSNNQSRNNIQNSHLPHTSSYESSNVQARPFQSSWNPHPKKPINDKPVSGMVADRIGKFNSNPPTENSSRPHQNNYPLSHRQSPPPPNENIAPNKQQHNSGPRKDVVATARGVLEWG